MQRNSMDRASTHPSLSNRRHEELLRWSTKIITFLNNLTTEQPVGDQRVKNAAMPYQAFTRAKALVFVFRKKWGFLGSYQSEVGFITKKLTAEDGTIRWSAPIFTKGNSVGLGLTIGRLQTGMCLALMNDEALVSASKATFRIGFKGQFLIDMDGAYLRAVRLDSTSQEDNVIIDGAGGMLAKYFRMEAMIVDFSMELITVSQNKVANRRLYGNDYKVDDVLNGKEEIPIEFNGVIDLLNRLAEAGRQKKNQRN
eukprot:jgi/Picsp_1/2642/NSC_00872-R1_actin cortical patch component lsb4